MREINQMVSGKLIHILACALLGQPEMIGGLLK